MSGRRRGVEPAAQRGAWPAPPSQRQSIAREDYKVRREYSAAVDDLFRVYDITMVGREALDGHDTIVATLVPKAGIKALTRDGKVMQHFKARAWISESDYELVRVENEAIDTLSFGLGRLARGPKGAVAEEEDRQGNILRQEEQVVEPGLPSPLDVLLVQPVLQGAGGPT